MKLLTGMCALVGLTLCATAYGDDAVGSTGIPESRVGTLLGRLEWHEDYATAYRDAQEQNKQLLIYFYNPRDKAADENYRTSVLAHADMEKALTPFVRALLPIDAEAPGADAAIVQTSSKSVSDELLDHKSFEHLRGRSGLAVIDLVDEKDHLHGKVVSAHSFSKGRHYTAWNTKMVLGLPRGTISQRTLVYAVRVHPERPQSTIGKSHPFMFSEARQSSVLMAQYGSVGHHDWGNRSARVGSVVGGSPSEVASMSSSTTDIVQAAKECVALWRTSGVHWNMVAAPQGHYGYDMVRSPNGAWYATGIFTAN